jgi:hypothetical protein
MHQEFKTTRNMYVDLERAMRHSPETAHARSGCDRGGESAACLSRLFTSIRRNAESPVSGTSGKILLSEAKWPQSLTTAEQFHNVPPTSLRVRYDDRIS